MRREQVSFGVIFHGGAENADGVLVTDRNAAEAVTQCYGTIAAPSGKAGYTIGCTYTNTSTGNIYVNQGTTLSCTFNPIGTIGAGGVTLANLAAGITPSHIVTYAGKHTTTGGSATEAFTVTGVAATDIVFAQIQTVGAIPRTLTTAAPTLNTVTLVFSGDPSTDHVISYQVLKAAA